MAGEGVVSQAATEEFREGYARTFGDRKPQRGRWIYDTAAGRLVPVDEYQAPEQARNAPILVDRYMEGTTTQDGIDIGSRAKRREYMRTANVVDASDTSPAWFAKRRAEADAETTRRTHETVKELANTDSRHLRKAVDELRRKR